MVSRSAFAVHPARLSQPLSLPRLGPVPCSCNKEMCCYLAHLNTSVLQEAGKHFLAGVLRHLPGIAAFLAASPNSYRRLVPSAWAGAFQVPLGRSILLGERQMGKYHAVALWLYC